MTATCWFSSPRESALEVDHRDRERASLAAGAGERRGRLRPRLPRGRRLGRQAKPPGDQFLSDLRVSDDRLLRLPDRGRTRASSPPDRRDAPGPPSVPGGPAGLRAARGPDPAKPGSPEGASFRALHLLRPQPLEALRGALSRSLRSVSRAAPARGLRETRRRVATVHGPPDLDERDSRESSSLR